MWNQGAKYEDSFWCRYADVPGIPTSRVFTLRNHPDEYWNKCSWWKSRLVEFKLQIGPLFNHIRVSRCRGCKSWMMCCNLKIPCCKCGKKCMKCQNFCILQHHRSYHSVVIGTKSFKLLPIIFYRDIISKLIPFHSQFILANWPAVCRKKVENL